MHYEFRHLLKNQTKNRSSWEDLSDILEVPQFSQPNVTIEPEIENSFFVFVYDQGRLTNHSHYAFYSAIACFLVTAVLLCKFHKQVKSCCGCFCRAKPYVPEISYNVKDDDVKIIEKAVKKDKLVKVTIQDVFENHEESAELGASDKLALKSGQATLPRDKVKITRPAPELLKPAETSSSLATPAVTQLDLGVKKSAADSGEFKEINAEYLTSLLTAANGGKK